MSTEATATKSEELKESEDTVEENEEIGSSEESIHWIQRFYDNPWILLVLGILIPFLSYTAWGWIELAMIQPAELP